MKFLFSFCMRRTVWMFFIGTFFLPRTLGMPEIENQGNLPRSPTPDQTPQNSDTSKYAFTTFSLISETTF